MHPELKALLLEAGAHEACPQELRESIAGYLATGVYEPAPAEFPSYWYAFTIALNYGLHPFGLESRIQYFRETLAQAKEGKTLLPISLPILPQ